jgi:WS/DGAT/MGAT family acyltransferase
VNDVVLALCAGALRAYLCDHGELPETDLVGMVPISVRTDEQMGTMGNRVSAMLTTLATSVADPVERLHAISDGTRRAKEQDRAIGAETLTNWTEFAAPALAARAARLFSSLKVAERMRPMFNVVVSNVPGPNFPLYSAGARMVAIYPMAPVADGVALNMTVMSYMGSVYFGLMAGREAVPDLESIADHVRDALEELLKATGAPAPAVPKRTRARKAAKGAVTEEIVGTAPSPSGDEGGPGVVPGETP